MTYTTQKPSAKPNHEQQLQIDRKYGMFLHFGINTFSEPACEWSDGTIPVSNYIPTTIDAEQWVKSAKDAGMSYVILITKHHDGFCLFDTKYTDYCVNNSPNKTDVVKAVFEACEKYDIQLGLYYSLWDRYAPCYNDDRAYADYMKNQITELLDGRYGKIVEFWFDGGWDKTSTRWYLEEVYDHIKKLQPNCVVGVNHTIGIYDSPGMGTDDYKPICCPDNSTMKYFPSDFRLWDPLITREGDADTKLYIHKGEQYYLPFEGTFCVKANGKWFWSPEYPNYPCVEPSEKAKLYNHFINQQNVFIVNCAPNRNGVIEKGDLAALLDAAKILGIGIHYN